MTGLTDSLVGALRQLNGDRKKGMFVAEACADAAPETDAKSTNHAKGESHVDDNVHSACKCTKDWGDLKNVGVPLECSLCKKWYCMNCAGIPRKGDITAINRPDVFWSCELCMSWAKLAVDQPSNKTGELDNTRTSSKLNLNQITPELQTSTDIVQTLKELESNIAKKYDATMRVVVPKGVAEVISPIKDDVSHKVNEKVTMLWNQTLFGDNDYPTLQEAAKDINVKPKQENKKQGPLATVVKQVVTKQKNEERKKENNIIIYSLPERKEETHEARKSAKLKIVNDILKAVGIEAEITQNHKTGNIQEANRGRRPKARSLKVSFKDSKIQQEVLSKMHMFTHALGPQ